MQKKSNKKRVPLSSAPRTKSKNKNNMKNWNTYKAAHVPAKREVEIPAFTEEEQKLLYDVMSIQTTSGHEEPMMLFILKWLEDKGFTVKVDDSNNMYITKGIADVYPTYVSHLDQIHRLATSFQIYTAGNKWFAYNKNTMSQVGIGGDDKVGIFICLQALLTFPACKVAFFTEEEIDF